MLEKIEVTLQQENEVSSEKIVRTREIRLSDSARHCRSEDYRFEVPQQLKDAPHHLEAALSVGGKLRTAWGALLESLGQEASTAGPPHRRLHRFTLQRPAKPITVEE